ncbi:MAG: Rnase Y domain-containing protein, partial [Bacteroidales bacterium]
MEILTIIILSILGAISGFVAAYYIVNNIVLKKKKEQILKESEIEGENIKKDKIFQAKEKFLQLKSEHEQFINERSSQIQQTETKIKQKELIVNQQTSELVKKQKEADTIKENLKIQVDIVNKKSEEYDKLRQEAIEKIENIAGMTAVEAKAQLVQTMKDEPRTQAMSYINDAMDEARLTASKEAKRIVINTIQRTAPETAIENAVTVFNIESDEIKGRIIGREGRNIRALEAATGV